MVVMGKNHATRSSFCETLAVAFEAGAAATTERRAGVLPWGEEWPEERVQQDPIPRCPHCGTRCRPEVLWFDESYNELHYRDESALTAAEAADCLLVVGTTLTTGLPTRVVNSAQRRGIPVLNIDPEAAKEPREGMLNLAAKSGAALPALLSALKVLHAEPDLPPLRQPAQAEEKKAAGAPEEKKADAE